MASIGGMDLPYGSQTQIVRTNVLCVAVKANGGGDTNVGVSVNAARAVHNSLAQKLPKSIAPDFTCFFEAGGAGTGDSGLTAAAYTAAFEQDQDNSGVADNVSLEDHGLLRSILQVPAMSGSARPGATFSTAGAKSYDTATTALAFGSAATALGQEDLEGAMAFEGILSVGATTLTSTTAATQDDLFEDAAGTTAGENVGDNEQSYTSDLQSQIMETVYEDFVGNYNGAAAAGHNTNGGNCYTLDLSGVLANTDVGAGASTTGVTTATATTEFNATTDATGLDTLLGNTVTSGIGGSAVILSVMSVCRKI